VAGKKRNENQSVGRGKPVSIPTAWDGIWTAIRKIRKR
jgi:hypothetical protein